MSQSPTLTHLALPLPWDAFGLPSPFAGRSTTLVEGEPSWRWSDAVPDLGIGEAADVPGTAEAGWDVDHVVLLVPNLDELRSQMAIIGCEPRLTLEVKGRPTAFYRVGTILEVIESPVRGPSLYGVALVTEEPLETVGLRWRSMGIEIGDVHAAIQPGRRIFSVGAVEAGLAVMSPDRSVG